MSFNNCYHFSIGIVLSLCILLPGFNYTFAQTEAKLLPDDGAAGDLFGYSVSIDGNYAAVGAYAADTEKGIDGGAVYVFRRSGDRWLLEDKIIPSDGISQLHFGSSVAINGSRLVVGAPWDDDKGAYSGSAYVYERINNTWSLDKKLVASDGQSMDSFGQSVAIYADHIIVGASGDDVGARIDAGSAYIFKDTDEGWVEEEKLLPETGATQDYFGFAVSITDSAVIVGAPSYDGLYVDSGAAYIFALGQSGWTQKALLTAPNDSLGDFFGRSVAISDSTALVGAFKKDSGDLQDTGAAYLYEFRNGEWSQVLKLVDDNAEAEDWFGYSVSVRGIYATVGAPQNRGNGVVSGAAFLYQRGEAGWQQKAKLVPSDGNTEDYYGNSVSISNEFPIVGAPNNDTNGNDAGAAYLYFSDAPLPVELAAFSAEFKNNRVHLLWQTKSETNNFGFKVQRKVKAEWETIGFIPGKGTSSETQNYQFWDAQGLKNSSGSEIQYRLKQLDNDGSFAFSKVVQVQVNAPRQYQLFRNYPNPFNPETTISFSLPQASFVSLKIYNVNGSVLKTLTNAYQTAGVHKVKWDGTTENGQKLSSGIYFYKLKAGSFSQIKKLILVR